MLVLATADADDRRVEIAWSHPDIPWVATSPWPPVAWVDPTDGTKLIVSQFSTSAGVSCFVSYDGVSWSSLPLAAQPNLPSRYYSNAAVLRRDEIAIIVDTNQVFWGTNMWECAWTTSAVTTLLPPPGPARFAPDLFSFEGDVLIYGGGMDAEQAGNCVPAFYVSSGRFGDWVLSLSPPGALRTDCNLDIVQSGSSYFLVTAFGLYSSPDAINWLAAGVIDGGFFDSMVSATLQPYPPGNTTAGSSLTVAASSEVFISAFSIYDYASPKVATSPFIATSLDLLTWTQYTHPPFLPRFGGDIFAFNEAVILLGGATGGSRVEPMFDMWIGVAYIIPSNTPTPTATSSASSTSTQTPSVTSTSTDTPSSTATPTTTPTQSPSSAATSSTTPSSSATLLPCAIGYYGQSCSLCPAAEHQSDFNVSAVCSGHGSCDGSGSRGGDGTCRCNLGWGGGGCAINLSAAIFAPISVIIALGFAAYIFRRKRMNQPNALYVPQQDYHYSDFPAPTAPHSIPTLAFAFPTPTAASFSIAPPNPLPRDAGEPSTCVVCLDSIPSFAGVPCGHLCLCSDCAGRSLASCPLCRADVATWQRVFR